jgi:hypothetical protein
MRPGFAAVIAVGLCLVGVAPVEGGCCSGLSMQQPTMRQQIAQAPLVTVMTPTRCFEAANGDNSFITELKVDQVIKAHAALGKQKQIQIARKLDVDPRKPAQFLVLFDVSKDGKLDPFVGIPIKSPDVVTYVSKAMVLDAKDVPAQLDFFSQYLEHADNEIALDAWRELEYADPKVLRKAAAKFSRVKLRAYLKSDKVPNYRKKLYASLLGVCGIDTDVDLLKSMLDGKHQEIEEGLLTGYVQLRPREGWKRVREFLQDKDSDFIRRYRALRTARYVYDERPDLIPKSEAIAAICLLLPQDDIADIVIEDLRKREYWDATTDVLNLAQLESHQSIPIVRRAIMRYALSAQHLPAAKTFVEEQRRKDAAYVEDIVELLKLEKVRNGGAKE